MISSSDVQLAKRTAMNRLAEIGIKDQFTVKIREPREDWIAMYRANSQFRGRPIFWISSKTDEVLADELGGTPTQGDVLGVVTSSILHEYGHVIAEWAAARSEPMRALLSRGWQGMHPYYGAHRAWDEERFAEDFAQWLYGGGFVHGDEDLLRRITELYVIEAFTE